jgi:hypothetical protein
MFARGCGCQAAWQSFRTLKPDRFFVASDGGGDQRPPRTVADKALPPLGGPFTLSLWVFPDGFARHDYGTPFSCGAAEPERALIVVLNGEEGDGRLLIGRYCDNVLKSKAALAAGQWNHVGLMYDRRHIAARLAFLPRPSFPAAEMAWAISHEVPSERQGASRRYYRPSGRSGTGG